MKKKKDRKSQGKFSVLDEFISPNGVGDIDYSINVPDEKIKKFEEATRLADIPFSARVLISSNMRQETNDESQIPKREGPVEDSNKNSFVDKAVITATSQEQQTDNKQVSNRYQTDNDDESKQVTNGQQTGNKQITKIIEKTKTDNKQVTKRVTEQVTIGEQTDNKQVTKCGFESIVGNEKNLLLLVFKECLRIGNLISPEITLSHISETLKISPGVAKTVIHRLAKKGFITRETSKTGRGGWIKFSIQKELYQDLRIRETDNKQITNGYQTDNKQVTKRVTEQVTTPPYSSSNLNINTTTIGVPDTYAKIAVPINLAKFGISEHNLQKLVTSGKITHDVVMRSLGALSFDVENGKSGNIANILFGILNSGREYISQKHSEALQKEIDQEIARLEAAEENQKRLAEMQLKVKFQEYMKTNPEFLQSVKIRHNGMLKNQELLEKVAFEEFKLSGMAL